jgi:hypothetical protein
LCALYYFDSPVLGEKKPKHKGEKAAHFKGVCLPDLTCPRPGGAVPGSVVIFVVKMPFLIKTVDPLFLSL